MTRQWFNGNDWAQATGGYAAGRGGLRPARQRTAPKTKTFVPVSGGVRSTKAMQRQAEVGRIQRRTALTRALIPTLSVPQPELRQRTTTIVSSGAYWRATPAERLRTLSVLQRFHGLNPR